MIVLAGKIKEMIEYMIQERSKGNPAIAEMTKAKFILKGLNPDKFNKNSFDDPIIIEKILNIAKVFNIKSFINDEKNIKSAYSSKCDEEEVIADIKSQLSGCDIKVLIFFASSCYDQEKLSNLMKEAFKDCLVLGCSTAGEIVSGKLLKNSVVAMTLNSNIVSDTKVEVIEHMKKNLNESVESAFSSFEKHFGESSYTMDAEKYIGIILIDGVSMKEERIMDLIGNRTDIFFIGGSAGDDLNFLKTNVYADGKTYTDSAVLLMMKINDDTRFSIIKTQSFKALDYVFTANKVNKEAREVIEFNNRPAIITYAEAVGTTVEDAPNHFMTHPVGLFVGDNNVFIRSPQQVKDLSMLFYCNILEGMEVRLLESTNIIEDTRKAVENKINELGSIDGIINFDCIERILELEKENLGRQYAEIFSDIPTIGFSTYGEEYIGHINQTSTMLVFRSKSNSLPKARNTEID